MKIVDRSFRKIFTFVCGTFTVLACQKNGIKDSVVEGGDGSPEAIRLSAFESSSVVTRAALEVWSNTELYVFGLKRDPGKEVGSGAYDFEDTDNIVAYLTTATSGTYCTLEVYSDKDAKIPYYYRRDYIYDFYGCHLGGADVSNETVSGDSYCYDLTFEGNNDLMCAATDREKDILASGNSPAIEKYVYSERSARMGVAPNLVFNHALTRLNFIIKGKGDKYQNVRVTGVEVKSVNKGTLVATGTAIGFVADSTAEEVALSLKAADDGDLEAMDVTLNPTDAVLGGDGACLMVAPGMEELDITLYLENKILDKPMDPYKFTAKAADVVKTDNAGNKMPVTSFESGHAYDFYINVYGPEEIFITAMLTPWEDGGKFEYDPDDHSPGGGTDSDPDDEPVSPDPSDGNESVGEEEGNGGFN